jgi:hypothetical protein
MNTHLRPIPILAALLLFAPVVACANPIVIPAVATSPLGVVIALVVESIMIALLMRRFGYDPVRVALVWFPVTLLTYRVYLVIAGTILIAELAVVFLEAAILSQLGRWRYLRPEIDRPLSRRDALAVALVGNLASVVAGVALSFVLW